MKKISVDISVVVPVYNGAATLAELHRRTVKALGDTSWELIFVDDRGSENDWKRICQLAEEDSRVRGYRLSVNSGQHAATIAGIGASLGRVVLTCDEDLQHPPEGFLELAAAVGENTPLVYARPPELPHSWWRNFTSRWTKKFVAALSGLKTAPLISSFRAMDGNRARQMAKHSYPNFFFDVLATRFFGGIGTVEIRLQKETARPSGYNFKRLLGFGLKLLLAASHRPLRLAGSISFVMLLLSAVFAGKIFWDKIMYNVAVQGWTSLMLTILALASIHFLIVGIISEYLINSLSAIRGYPVYTFSEATQGTGDNALAVEFDQNP